MSETLPSSTRPLRDVHPAPQPPAPVDTSALPTGPTPYHHFLRTPRSRWWRAALSIVLLVVAYLVISFGLGMALVVVSLVAGLDLVPVDGSTMTMTPALLLVNNIALALLIPVSLGLQRLLHGQSGRWLHSVHGRFRWNLALRLAAVLLPLWAVYAIGFTLFAPEMAGAGGAPATLVSTTVMLLITLLTTPLQAAGEEYAARGILARSFASFTSHPTAALVLALVPANLLFMVAHGAGDWTLAAYYFGFGLACSLVTWRTGGVEAAVVLHAVNNTTLFAVAAFLTSEIVIDRSAGTGGPIMLVPLAVMALTTAGIWVWSRRRGLATAADPTA
ncbi:CPBP family intramembrane glutamic endopeptidase [Desertihabitans aurantiacus]|uniref:CPBP family intramembrane glutamic endopeptidase n=1 Tax=Desertihabitans aurantiacus TaxID=2282477 RepID=UPI000DF73EC4|nr:CPBP family intramembrane glutamic endopeptidase [Desertihabitans aurantiacus]